MIRLIAAIFFLGTAMTINADNITTNDGITYNNVKVTEKTPLGIKVVSSEKAYWIDYRDLPPDVAAQYGYDADKLQDFESNLQQSSGCTLPDNAVPDVAPIDPNNSMPPPSTTNTYIANPGSPVIDGLGGGGSYSYVYWGGNYYPWNSWHNWYWNHHWVNHNGRYYPAPYYYHHGLWHDGHYYPYHPHRLYTPKPGEQHYSPAHQCNYHGGNYHGGESHGGGGHGGGRR